MKTKKAAPHPGPQIRAYFAKATPEGRRAITLIRDAIRSAVPDAVEWFSYGIPGFRLEGKPLLWYAAWTAHASLYPMTAGLKQAHAEAMSGYEMSKGTIRFPLGGRLPIALVKGLARTRAAEIRAAAAPSKGKR